ncbi:uncharacterized protein NPIL_31031, partial [Nephila pilipes]
IVD